MTAVNRRRQQRFVGRCGSVGLGVMLAAAIAVSSPVHADEPSDEQRARALFFEAHEAADAGELERACETFAASLALFRRGSTLLNLGRCHRGLGRMASALKHFREAAALLEQDDPRLGEARSQVEELERLAPRVTIRLPAELPSTLRISLDGQFVATRELTEPLRLDAGSHQLVTEAEGYERRITSITVQDGKASEVVLQLGERTVSAALPPPPPTPEPRMTPPAANAPVPIWSWVTGAIGVAMAGGAVPFFVDYRNVVDRQLDICGGALEACDPEPPGSYDPGPDNRRRDRDLGLGTTLAVLGGGAIVAAVVGALVAPEEDTVLISAHGLRLSF